MPTWGQQLVELAQLERGQLPPNTSPVDVLRRKYLARLNATTHRAAIVYATPWLENKANDIAGQAMSVNLGDLQGFMETCYEVPEKELDLIITSPGGSPDAAESIMAYLRTQFDHIRAVIPVAAMSAATMMALAADEIVMGAHSQLGPIDPQFTVMTPEGPRFAPGQAILDQFELAKKQCQDPANIGAWLPMLRALLPGLLAQCEASRELAEQSVKKSMETYMFAGNKDGPALAEAAAKWFANFNFFKSHARRVSRDDARALQLNVTNLEADKNLQDAVLSVHHAVRHTFNSTAANKIIENHNGRAYIEQTQQVVVQVQQQPPQAPNPPTPPGPLNPPPPALNRSARRQQGRKSK
jgi:hypothetical protein